MSHKTLVARAPTQKEIYKGSEALCLCTAYFLSKKHKTQSKLVKTIQHYSHLSQH